MKTSRVVMALAISVAAGLTSLSASAQLPGEIVPPLPHAASQAFYLSDADIGRQVDAYLSTIDTPIPSSAWNSLGVRAQPILAAIIDDHGNLPSRRAKAIDGLAALGASQSLALFQATALSSSEPIAVRFAAVRALGQAVDPNDLPATISSIFEAADDSRVRALAAVVLVRRAGVGSCPSVRAQLSREAAEKAGQFDRALALCAGR
ncbi:MAG TPA: HEAT repeat domain-containing protein [Casimicrobiaceae bacterium]|nr:HEAT repeat domain-containing protein [Casimicrobiaceae bacterium]